MDVVVHAHAIPFIGTLTKVNTKGQLQLKIGSYFDELMCIANIADLEIRANTMHQYVFGPAALKTMMPMCYRHFLVMQPQSYMSINQGLLSP